MVMSFMTVGRRQVFLWILIKGSFTSRTAKIINLPLEFRFPSSSFGINIHATYRVFCHCYLLMLKFLNFPLQEATLE